MKTYWLCSVESDRSDLNVFDGPYNSWEDMLQSDSIAKLVDQVIEGDIDGYFYLIVRPQPMWPIIGGFIPGMEDPS